jgi:hypothetical protein
MFHGKDASDGAKVRLILTRKNGRRRAERLTCASLSIYRGSASLRVHDARRMP